MSESGWPEGTEALLDEILLDAHGDDEQLWAIRQAFEDNVNVPTDAFVIGEPVECLAVDYDGNTRRGLTVRCRRQDGSEHAVAASEVVIPDGSVGAMHVAAYRKGSGLEPAARANRVRMTRTSAVEIRGCTAWPGSPAASRSWDSASASEQRVDVRLE